MIGVCYGQDVFGKVPQTGAEYSLLPQGQGLYSKERGGFFVQFVGLFMLGGVI